MTASANAVITNKLSSSRDDSDSEVEGTTRIKTAATDYLQEHLTTPLPLKTKQPRGARWKGQGIIRVLDLWHEYKHYEGATKAAFCQSIEASEEFDYVTFAPRQLRRMLGKDEEYRETEKRMNIIRTETSNGR